MRWASELSSWSSRGSAAPKKGAEDRVQMQPFGGQRGRQQADHERCEHREAGLAIGRVLAQPPREGRAHDPEERAHEHDHADADSGQPRVAIARAHQGHDEGHEHPGEHVDHGRGGQRQLPEPRVGEALVFEDAGHHREGGDRQRRGDEQREGPETHTGGRQRGVQRGRDGQAQRDRHDHAQDTHRAGGSELLAHALVGAQLEAHDEHEHHQAHGRQRGQAGERGLVEDLRVQRGKQRPHDDWAEQHAGGHFTDHAGLAEVTKQPAAGARGDQDDDELEQQDRCRHGRLVR